MPISSFESRRHRRSGIHSEKNNLLEFPTIVFMQSGYNVYSLLQAARRSWRIGQKTAGQSDLPGLRSHFEDDLPGADGQDDCRVSEHVGRRAGIRARFPESGWRLDGSGTGTAVGEPSIV